MKLGLGNKIYKRNKITTKKKEKKENKVISMNCDVIVIFQIYGQFGAIRKPDSRSIVCKTYIFINRNLSSYKNRKQNQKISNTAFTLLF